MQKNSKYFLELLMIRFIKIFALIFFFCAENSYAAGKVTILNWQENSNLTESGKNSEILIQAQIKDLPPQYVMTSFSVTFDPSQKIKVSKVLCDDVAAQYAFSNNNLAIKFPKSKKNNETIWIYFSYEEHYEKLNKFLREEAILIPDFAVGAKAKVAINFAENLESATLNSHIIKEPNRFIYSNIVPANGVREIVKLTPSQSVWEVNVQIKMSSDKALNKISFSFPDYFQSPGQKVENYVIASDGTAIDQKVEKKRRTLTFNTIAKEITVQNRAKISTGKKFRQNFIRDPNHYLKFTAEEQILLSSTLENIKKNPQYSDLPLYAKIGKFTHEFIKYDASYVGKLPPVKEILRNPVGVCTEYASLYSALARIAGIPSIIIHGGACGEYNKCEGHSWNMIYQQGKWIEVDPTWNLMSGVVSSSHIYFNDEDNDQIISEYDGGNMVNAVIDLQIKNLF